MKNKTKIIIGFVAFCLVLSCFITFMIIKFGGSSDSYSTVMSVSSDSSNSMKMSYKYFQGARTREISLKKGEVLTINYKSSVTKGSMTLKVLDASGNTIKLLDSNSSGKETITAEENQKIRIRAFGDKASGSYEVSWNK